MSKIEDALKKAKAHKENASSGSLSLPETTSQQGTVATGTEVGVIKKSSSSLISLMKDEAAADSDELLSKRIIVADSSRASVTDSFRYLRTKLLHESENNNFIVLVTSCAEGKDSAFVSINMGAAFALDNSKTSLVIDCDIKAHRLEDMMDIDYDYGLLDYLENDEIEVSEILNDIGVKRLRVIASGQRDHIEGDVFTLDKMKQLLDGLLERYQDRYVVINSPPISDSVDTNLLIDLVDYVVVVAPYANSTYDSLEKTLSRVDKSKLLGVVVNDVPEWS